LWSISAWAACDLDLPASDDFAANEAETFVIQRTPLAELIEPTQRVDFL
jgi:hypothetical protein